MTSPTAILNLYKAVMWGFHPFARSVLHARAKAGKEDLLRLEERLGAASVARPKARLIWFHGVSVGEALSALPIMEGMAQLYPEYRFLLTSATTTSADLLKMRLSSGMIHAYAPIDTPQAVTAFLDHWQPDLAVFIESDLWPNLLAGLDERGIKRLLLSARITQKTYHGWQKFRTSVTHILAGFSAILPQDKNSAAYVHEFGAKLGPLTNLKRLGKALEFKEDQRLALKAQIGSRPVIVAASTHDGEEAIMARLVTGLRSKGLRPLMIIVPRHPIRASTIRAQLSVFDLNLAQRSQAEPITDMTDIYLADSLGELGLWFCLSDLSLICGSFVPDIGGHNPLEATRLGKSVIFGHSIENWQSIYDDVLSMGAGFQVKSEDELGQCVYDLLQKPQTLLTAHQAALSLGQDETAILNQAMAAITRLMKD